MTAEGWKGFCKSIARCGSTSSEHSVLPGADDDERPEVLYHPFPYVKIEVGMAATISLSELRG